MEQRFLLTSLCRQSLEQRFLLTSLCRQSLEQRDLSIIIPF
jgi:hypothetical protein